jgi:hypothetical protein
LSLKVNRTQAERREQEENREKVGAGGMARHDSFVPPDLEPNAGAVLEIK